MVNLVVIGISIHSKTHAPLLLLYPMGTQKILCLPIDPMEAFTVSKALHGFGEEGSHLANLFANSEKNGKNVNSLSKEEEALRRPLVHDLLLEVLNSFGSSLLSVSLIDEQDGFYFAETVISNNLETFHLSCRPADAIALALRSKMHIRIAKTLLSHAENISDIMGSLPEHTQSAIQTVLAPDFSLSSFQKEGDSNTLSSLADIKRFNTLLQEKKVSASEKESLTNKNGVIEKTTLGLLSDSEQWTDILFSLAPETKKHM